MILLSAEMQKTAALDTVKCFIRYYLSVIIFGMTFG